MPQTEINPSFQTAIAPLPSIPSLHDLDLVKAYLQKLYISILLVLVSSAASVRKSSQTGSNKGVLDSSV
ncbi:MAG: hypothetical protein ABG776_10610, partial [Cyanobacteria bacterium J06555_13]